MTQVEFTSCTKMVQGKRKNHGRLYQNGTSGKGNKSLGLYQNDTHILYIAIL